MERNGDTRQIVPATTVLTKTPAPCQTRTRSSWITRWCVNSFTEQRSECQADVTAFGTADGSDGREDIWRSITEREKRHALEGRDSIGEQQTNDFSPQYSRIVSVLERSHGGQDRS